jgi:hypothetical protein
LRHAGKLITCFFDTTRRGEATPWQAVTTTHAITTRCTDCNRHGSDVETADMQWPCVKASSEDVVKSTSIRRVTVPPFAVMANFLLAHERPDPKDSHFLTDDWLWALTSGALKAERR